MSWVDIVIILIISLAAFSSMRTGFLRQALSLIGVVVGTYAALTHYTTVARPFETATGNATVANVVAFVLILIGVWWAFSMLAALVRSALKSWGLAWTDNLMGMVTGFLAGLFFTVCFLLLFIRVPITAIQDSVQESALASVIFQILPHLRKLLPSDLSVFKVI
jgi:membrane protein required for colicin V production